MTNLLPIRGHLGQVEAFTEVNQIQNVLLEATAAETCQSEARDAYIVSRSVSVCSATATVHPVSKSKLKRLQTVHHPSTVTPVSYKVHVHLPTLACRNLLPMRESLPMACATSLTSAPVDSHTADMALMDEIG